MTFRFHPEAREDLLGAHQWYEAMQTGLGRRLRILVERAIDRIVALPLASPLWPNTDPDLCIRRYVLRQFPYSIAYLIHDETIVILAIAHHRRRPGYWLHRVEDA